MQKTNNSSTLEVEQPCSNTANIDKISNSSSKYNVYRIYISLFNTETYIAPLNNDTKGL